jgi:N-acylneuraminate cytidylyltransferase
MSAIAVIPARGGSKRIPRKNIRLFAGRPLIHYSIEAARASGLFTSVIVSTDDPEIAEVASQAGAEVPFMRPQGLADDYAGTDAVVIHSLEWLEKQGRLPETVCCIYATAPFLRAEDLKEGFKQLREKGCSAAFSVTTFAYCIFRSLRCGPDGRLQMFWPENRLKRSQDFPEAWHDAGQFYWGDVARYRQNQSFFTDACPVIIPRWRVQDIDTPEDWERAEKLFTMNV